MTQTPAAAERIEREGAFLADVVREVARLAKAMGREVATPDDTREMLGMA